MKKMLALVMALAMTFSMAAFGQAEEITPPKKPLRYSLGTSSSGGNFYLVGGGIATVLNNALPDFFVMTAEETGGSTANLTLIQNGEAEVGISMTSAIAEAVKGEADWTGGQMDKIRGMVALYPSYLTIYSLKSTGATKLTDLNGKIVGLGSKGAAMDSILREAFDKMGITPSSIFNDGHSATASAVATATSASPCCSPSRRLRPSPSLRPATIFPSSV